MTMLVGALAILLVMIPVTGLTVVLSLRLAIAPFAESVVFALSETGLFDRASDSGVEDLRREVDRLRARLDELELSAQREAPALPPPPNGASGVGPVDPRHPG